nr:hypothetical protein [Streptomyces lavenduligriseus]
MRAGHGLHDGEPEARGTGGAGPRGVAPGEPLEDVRQQPGGNARTVVLHVHARPRPVPAHPRGDGRTGRGVLAGVAQQVDQHLLDPGRVRRDRRRDVGQVEPPGVVRTRRAGVADGVDDQRDQIGVLPLERTAGVEPGEQQQVLHEQGHPPRLRLDPPEGVPGVGPDLLVSAPGEFGVSADGGERGAQLMAGVRHELAHPCLAALPGVQGAVDVVEHPVERGADPADLRVRVALRLGDPFAQVHLAGVQRQFGDPGGGGGDPSQGAGGDADEHVAGDGGGDESGGGDADFDQDQGVDVVVGVLGGQRHVEGVGTALARHVLHAVIAEARDPYGVRGAVPRHRAERRLLRAGQAVGTRPLEEAVVVVLPPGDGRAADRGAACIGGDGAERGRPLRQQVLHLGVRGGGVRHAGQRPGTGTAAGFRVPDPAQGDLGDLAVQLLVQMRAQRQRGHRADHRAHHRDQRHGRDDEPCPQGARLTRPAPPGTGPPPPAHDAAGLIR